jgi:hypothetical protein
MSDETDVRYQHRYKHASYERAEKTVEERHKTVHPYMGNSWDGTDGDGDKDTGS